MNLHFNLQYGLVSSDPPPKITLLTAPFTFWVHSQIKLSGTAGVFIFRGSISILWMWLWIDRTSVASRMNEGGPGSRPLTPNPSTQHSNEERDRAVLASSRPLLLSPHFTCSWAHVSALTSQDWQKLCGQPRPRRRTGEHPGMGRDYWN